MDRFSKIVLCSALVLTLMLSTSSISPLSTKSAFGDSPSFVHPAAVAHSTTGGSIQSSSTKVIGSWTGTISTKVQWNNLGDIMNTDEKGKFTFTIDKNGVIKGSGTGVSTLFVSGSCNGKGYFNSKLTVQSYVSARDKNNNPTRISLAFTRTDLANYDYISADCPNKIPPRQSVLGTAYLGSGETYIALVNGASATIKVNAMAGSGQQTIQLFK